MANVLKREVIDGKRSELPVAMAKKIRGWEISDLITSATERTAGLGFH